MWRYIGKRTLWHIGLTVAAILMVCLLFYPLPGLSAALAWLLSWLIRYVLLVARTVAALPRVPLREIDIAGCDGFNQFLFLCH